MMLRIVKGTKEVKPCVAYGKRVPHRRTPRSKDPCVNLNTDVGHNTKNLVVIPVRIQRAHSRMDSTKKNDEEHNDDDGATIFFVVSLKSFDGIDHHLMFVVMPALSRVIWFSCVELLDHISKWEDLGVLHSGPMLQCGENTIRC
jgi:hypothetical protein